MFNTFLTSEADQNNNMGAFSGPIFTSVRDNNLLYVGGQFLGVAGYKSAPLTVLDYTGADVQILENPIDFKLDQYFHGNGVSFNDIQKLDDNSYVCSIAQTRSNNQYYISDGNGLPLIVNQRIRYGHYVNITPSGLNTGWALGMGGGKDGRSFLMLNSRTGWLFGGGNNVSTFLPPNTTQNPGSRTVNRVTLEKDSRNSMGYYIAQNDTTCFLSRTVNNASKDPFFVTGSFYPSGGTGIIQYGQTFTINDGKTLGGISAHEIISGFAITGLQSCNGSVTHARLDPVRNAIYFIGSFTTVNGVTRNRAAACDLNFNLLPWDPNLGTNQFNQLELGKSGIYILAGGSAMNPRGSGDPYNYIAKFDYDNGNLISQFAPDRGGTPQICGYGGKTLKEFGDGKFLLIEGGNSINNDPVINSYLSANSLSTDIALSGRKHFGSVNIIDTISGKYLYGTLDHYRAGVLGVSSQSVKRIIDNKLFFPHTSPCASSNNKTFKQRINGACIDLSNNSITNWAPEIYHSNPNICTLNTMYLDSASQSMFLGGSFEFVNGQSRGVIARVDLISGKTNFSFNPNLDYYNSDRTVTCIEKSGNILYVGGQFQKNADINTRFFAGIDTGTSTIVEGLNWQIQDFPNPINKEGYSRAHLGSSLVHTMKRKDNLLYVGGRFTQVSGLSRSGLFCYDIHKKQITDLNIPFDDVIYSLDIDYTNNVLYTVGRFHTVNGLPRPRGAAIDLTTSGVTNWSPSFSRHPLDVKVHPSGIIVAGTFADLGTGKAHTLTAFDFNTTEMQRYPRSTSTTDLYCMDIYSGKLYIGGSNLSQNDTLALDRSCIAYELNNGRLYTGWAPNPSSTITAMKIHQDSGAIYIGGNFTSVRSDVPASTTTVTRNRIAAWDIKTNPHTFLTSFDPNLNSTCSTLTYTGNMLYMGGSFTTVGGVTRNRLAAWNLDTNTLDASFNPNIGNNSVLFMKISGDHMYIGGDFTLVGGVTRNRCAKVRLSDGALDTNFNPNFNGAIRAIDISGNYLYAGGNFTTVGVTTKRKLCAVNPNDGIIYNNFTPIPTFDTNTIYYSDPSSYTAVGYLANGYDYVEDVKVIPGTGVGFCGYHFELYQNSGNRGVHFVNSTGGALLKTFGGYADSVWESYDTVGGGQTVQGRAGEEFMVDNNKLYVVNRQSRDYSYETMNRLTNKNAFLTITNKTNGDPIMNKNFTLNTNTEGFYGRGFGGETQWLRQHIRGINYSGDNVYFYGEFLDTYPEERISIGSMGIDGKLKKDFKLFSI